ncbi:MAG: hypothetical protein L0Z62_19765 [Gemmataceae bacterium]|nr:hypothetical protein [Gemmataceae bacterium]
MRIAVLVVGILGSLGAGALGVLWLLACQKDEQDLRLLRLAGVPVSAQVEREFEQRTRAYPFLLAGLVLGGAGAALGMAGRGLSAAALLLAAAIGPAILNPQSLIFTSLLVVAGGLAFFIRPRTPAPEPEPARLRPPLEAEQVEDAGVMVEPVPPQRVKKAGRGA